MAELAISNVVTISVSEPGAGIGEYNTSNLACFTAEPPGEGFGDDGYKLYVEPTEVGTDFGTDSQTYKAALAIFSQSPNILANNGYLVVISMVAAVQSFALTGVPASGSFTLAFGGSIGTTAAINWNDTASAIQTKLRVLPGLENAVVTGSLASQEIEVALHTYGPVTLPTPGGVGLQTSAPAAITITPATETAGETIAAAITRTVSVVQYFGLMGTDIYSQTDMLAAAAVIQALPTKIGFFVQTDEASVEVGGSLDLLRSGGFDQSRGLFYGDDETNSDPIIMQASYAGRALSTNFEGSNTTQNMNLKDLTGVQPDATMTQTLKQKCDDAGADIYASIQGVAKVLCSGENTFFDRVYNRLAYVGSLQVAIFNVLAQTSTKIPQTESGVQSLKSAARQVCEQYVTNQFLAPGTWTSPTTFGNQQDLYDNVSQRGYYIYSQPISQQSPASRAARIAPLMQIAAKEAGAIDKATVLVNINA